VAPSFDDPANAEPVPAPLAAAVEQRLADPRFGQVTLSASVWMEGYGEIVAHDADTPLFPASNQKLLTALGALMLLPPDDVFRTDVRASGTVVDGVLDGDLVVVAGGDPTLTRTGPNSLDELARRVRDAGIRRVGGSVVVDVSRHEAARTALGWQDWQIPTYAGPLSAFVVDDNRYRIDDAYLVDPAAGNGAAFLDALVRRGVVVDGTVTIGVANDGGLVLASTTSPPIREVVADMLLRSDNEDAEMLVREVAARSGEPASTADGVREIVRAVERGLCLRLHGQSADGSGLSRADLRSARELRTVLQAALASPWGPAIDDALPVGGRTGTLARRFTGTAAAGNLRAKTGSIIGGRALTGHLRSAGGRHVVFSLVVNGDGSPQALGAIDALVVTLASDRS
jgi:D-alanyl-D-alanine carboxypeptidase/D-alanyl-D-alanine-endopeptidase (penicillin-binding protein 4)